MPDYLKLRPTLGRDLVAVTLEAVQGYKNSQGIQAEVCDTSVFIKLMSLCRYWSGPKALCSPRTSRERLIRSHSSARFSFKLSRNSN